MATTTKYKTDGKRKAARRELIDTGRDKRYVRRNDKGQFNESDHVGRSGARDRKRQATRATQPGHGDKGDRRRTTTKRKG